MPYQHLKYLPDSVRKHLPKHAQEIYQAAFNNAWNEYDHNEARSHQVAWAAVKHKYAKDEAIGMWVGKAD